MEFLVMGAHVLRRKLHRTNRHLSNPDTLRMSSPRRKDHFAPLGSLSILQSTKPKSVALEPVYSVRIGILLWGHVQESTSRAFVSCKAKDLLQKALVILQQGWGQTFCTQVFYTHQKFDAETEVASWVEIG